MWLSCATNSQQQKRYARNNISEQAENSEWTWGVSWRWMGCTTCYSLHLPVPSTVSVLVCSCYDRQLSWVLSHQREIRVNSPFTFVYEEIPLHCLLHPLPLLKSHHRSGKRQGQERCHSCERTNMQLLGCPSVLQDQGTVSTGCNNLDKKITRVSVKTDSDIILSGDYFRQS